ncbi:hypothetical protein MRB53_040858 [Persea americana]|nr:hypothetical protein MRB53_040858 [Persea americana]
MTDLLRNPFGASDETAPWSSMCVVRRALQMMWKNECGSKESWPVLYAVRLAEYARAQGVLGDALSSESSAYDINASSLAAVSEVSGG